MALNTDIFVVNLITEGYTHICSVPCSFTKNLINEAINNENIEYIPSASEAVAVSVAAGLKMSGAKPIVIVQSSGLTNMGSNITSLLKPYGVTFPILTSWRTYKDGGSEIQHQHLATKLPSLIESYGYEYAILDENSIDNAIDQINICDTTYTIGVINEYSFSKVELKDEHKLNLLNYTPRSKFFISLNSKFKDINAIFIGTTGHTSREMFSFMPDTDNFYMAGNMGGALSLGLGAAMGGKKVIVCGGDAEFVMHMGGLTTAGRYKDVDLTYILFDNEQNKSTGGQNTYQSHVDYIGIAKSSNLDVEEKIIIDLKGFSNSLANLSKGLNFICVKCGVDNEVSRPPLNSVKVSRF
jgi:sulfopyruvate decarboxylase TPP-binding subunit